MERITRAWVRADGAHLTWAGRAGESGQAEQFWRAYGEVATWVCVSTMLLAGLLVVLSFVLTVSKAPPPTRHRPLNLWRSWIESRDSARLGALAFIVALVIHEFGHGYSHEATACAFAPLVCSNSARFPRCLC